MKQSTLEWWCNLKQKERDRIIEGARRNSEILRMQEEIPKLSENTLKVMNELAGGTQ